MAAVTCPNCGYDNASGFDSCENCGSLLPRHQPPPADRPFCDPGRPLQEPERREPAPDGRRDPRPASHPAPPTVPGAHRGVPRAPRGPAETADPFGYDPFAGPDGGGLTVTLRLPDSRVVTLEPGDRLVLGRGKDSPLADIATKNISRVHAVVTVARDGAFLTDEDSVNGTYLNGEQIQPRREYRLRGVAAIALGADPPLRIHVEVSGE